MSYNPGTPTTPRALGGDLYAVDSFRGEGKSYTVNLRAMTCDCPHYTARLAGTDGQCKHLVACIDYAHAVKPTALETAASKAARLTDEDLRKFAALKNGTAAGCACLLELAQRQIAADRDAELRAIFA
jgi:hypothetical protein